MEAFGTPFSDAQDYRSSGPMTASDILRSTSTTLRTSNKTITTSKLVLIWKTANQASKQSYPVKTGQTHTNLLGPMATQLHALGLCWEAGWALYWQFQPVTGPGIQVYVPYNNLCRYRNTTSMISVLLQAAQWTPFCLLTKQWQTGPQYQSGHWEKSICPIIFCNCWWNLPSVSSGPQILSL